MMNMPVTLLRRMATLDDADFIKWAARIGYVPAPKETSRAFRERVVASLERLNKEIDKLESQ